MKAQRWGVWLLLVAFCAGCRSGGNNELLERDLRWQEEEINELETALHQCEAQLDSSRRENESLKRELSGDRGAAENPAAPALDTPTRRPKSRSRSAPPESLSAPMVEEGELVDPGEGLKMLTPAEGAAYRKEKEPTDQRVARIVLNKQLTGGISHHGHADEGVLVVFQPRNALGEMVKQPGDLSIAVIDATQSGPAARVARWDFASDEMLSHYRKSPLGKGYQFELPWPDAPPTSRQLQLFVRYITPDGRKLMADTTIEVNPPQFGRGPSWHTAPPREARAQPGPRRAPVIATIPVVDSDQGEEPLDTTDAPADREAAAPAEPKETKNARPSWSPYR